MKLVNPAKVSTVFQGAGTQSAILNFVGSPWIPKTANSVSSLSKHASILPILLRNFPELLTMLNSNPAPAGERAYLIYSNHCSFPTPEFSFGIV